MSTLLEAARLHQPLPDIFVQASRVNHFSPQHDTARNELQRMRQIEVEAQMAEKRTPQTVNDLAAALRRIDGPLGDDALIVLLHAVWCAMYSGAGMDQNRLHRAKDIEMMILGLADELDALAAFHGEARS